MPFLILGLLAGVFLLTRKAPLTSAQSEAQGAAKTVSPETNSKLGDVLSKSLPIIEDIVVVGAGALVGGEAGGAADDELFGPGRTGALDTARHDVGIGTGALGGALAGLVVVGWVTAGIAIAIFAIAVFAYFTFAFIAQIARGSTTHDDGLKAYIKQRDSFRSDLFSRARAQPDAVHIPDLQLERILLPIVDGYSEQSDLVSFNRWKHMAPTMTFGESVKWSPVQVAEKGYSIGFFVGEFDLNGNYVGVPPELKLSKGGSASDGDTSGAWASKYVPASERVFVSVRA